MSAHATQTGLSYLIVFDGHDDAICSAGELMMNHGSQVQWVPDVYSAMAQLCTGNLPSRLIVDVRILDESELAFINLAPRYFPELKVTVPTLDGTLSRINGFKGRYETLSLTDITDEALGIRAAVADEITDEAEVVEWGGEEAVATDEAIEEDAEAIADAIPEAAHDPLPSEITISDDPWAPDPAEDATTVETEIEDALLDHGSLEDDIDPTKPHHTEYDGGPALDRLSTDGGPESVDQGPSLHDAVRQRMGGAQPPGRRLPPGSMAFQGNPLRPDSPRMNPSNDSAITPEEMDALLADDADASERGADR